MKRSVRGGLSVAIAAAVMAVVAAEPDGTEWQDCARQSFGCEAPRSFFAPFASERLARKILPKFSDRQLSLDSDTEWRFFWSKDPASRPQGFQRPDFSVLNWPVIKVPCSWQAKGANGTGGWGTPVYVNIRYPFARNAPKVMDEPPKDFTSFAARNPVGCYRRDFRLPTGWIGDVESEPANDIFLKFDGVDSFFYLWVNGQYVGFSKDSRSPAEFNVTRMLRPGVNTVALEVYRYSDGSYLEDQDMFRLSGIFRSTWLIRRPRNRIRDFFVKASPVERDDLEGDWNLEVTVEGGGNDIEVMVFTFDDIPVLRGKSGKFIVHRPKLWSAETPNCYKILIGNGEEFVSTLFGFRTSEIIDGRYLLNGKPVKLKGANRHETHPMYGHYVPPKTHERDIAELKAANCNCVRNSHYPQDDYWYYLCDTKGLYLVDEANVESHGYGYGKDSLSHRKEWTAATVHRNLAMVERNKNHPSVVIWSMGNEAGPGMNFTAAAAAIRRRDVSRPLHYERDWSVADMEGCQYPSVKWLAGKAAEKGAKKPFYVSEYAHNMVNAMGNLADYQRIIESSDVILGATIWDWVDQGLYRDRNGRQIIAYGGDFGDQPNDGQFVMNGCVLSDRTREPGFYEIQHVFQNWTACATNDYREIVVRNKNFFIGSSGVMAEWKVLRNGSEFALGHFDVSDLGPRSEKVFPLPERAVAAYRYGGTVSLRVTFMRGGKLVADDQIDFPEHAPAFLGRSTGAPRLKDEKARRTLVADGVTYSFDRRTGALCSISTGGFFFRREWLARPLRLDAFRAPSSNETGLGETWMRRGLHNLVCELVTFSEPVREAGELCFTVETVWRGAASARLKGYGTCATSVEPAGEVADRLEFRVVQRWAARKDGTLVCRSTITPAGKSCELARIGFAMTLAADNPVVDWFGAGPEENYRDRMSGAHLGLYRLPVSDFFFPYARPEDCGNRENTRAVMFSPKDEKHCLSFETGGQPFAFSVNPYDAMELVRHNHPAELPASHKTEFGLYAATRGLGGASCGPGPLERDIIRADRAYSLDFVIRPGQHLTGVRLAPVAATASTNKNQR